MPKTNFINGTIVQPAFLNAVFAHAHDGADADGSAAKIDLVEHITGQLPAANIGAHLHDGEGNQEKINLTRDVSGFSGGSIDMEFIGFLGGNVTVAIPWQKQVLNDDTALVTLCFPDFAEVSTTTFITSVNGALPAQLRPPAGVLHFCYVKSGAATMRRGVIVINETGLIVFAKSTGDEFYLEGFESTGNKGWHPFVVQYSI